MIFNLEDQASGIISDVCHGEIVSSSEKEPVSLDVEVYPLRNQIIKVIFPWRGYKVNFRGILESNEEGIFMTIQEKIGEDYILNGIEGFVRGMPKAHGGLVQLLRGVFFNISLSHYSGIVEELYFYGKRDKYLVTSDRRK